MGIRALCCALLVLGATPSFPTPVAAQGPELGAAAWSLPALRSPLGFEAEAPAEGSADRAPQVRPARGRGALWGAGIGAVAGGLLGGLTVGSDGGDDGFGGSLVETSATGEAVVLGALVGAGLGALLGATVFAPSRFSASFDVARTLAVRPLASVDGVGTIVRISW